jgi:preprotein translocase subunit SecA
LIGESENNDIEKRIFLQIIDFSWRAHLQYLEELRQVIGLRSYGQKDPLSEFKKESFNLFEGLLEKIKIDVVKFLLNLNVVISREKEVENKIKSKIPENCLLNLMKNQKIQRNEKCAATGKKFKNCCGANL